MRFGILGATTAWRPDGQPVAIGGPRLRALLARLLLDAGRTVPVDRLVDDLYGERPPKKVANALQSQVSRLRQVLPDHPVEFPFAVPTGRCRRSTPTRARRRIDPPVTERP